jgi:flap endonuclease-1
VGPVTAYKHIKVHGSIEQILENEVKVKGKLEDVEKYLEMVNQARGVFGMLPDVKTIQAGSLEQGVWNDGEVDRFLEERHGIRMVDEETEDAGDRIQEID